MPHALALQSDSISTDRPVPMLRLQLSLSFAFISADMDDDDLETPTPSMKPTLQRADANATTIDLDDHDEFKTIETAPNPTVAVQFIKYPYLTFAKVAAKGYVHQMERTLDIFVPDEITALCVQYSFDYEVGMLQLAQHVLSTLGALNKPEIPHQMFDRIIANYFQCGNAAGSISRPKVSEERVRFYYDELVRLQHFIPMNMTHVTYIGILANTPITYFRVVNRNT